MSLGGDIETTWYHGQEKEVRHGETQSHTHGPLT